MGLIMLTMYIRKKWDKVTLNGSMKHIIESQLNSILTFNVAPANYSLFKFDAKYNCVFYSAIAKLIWFILCAVFLMIINVSWIDYIILSYFGFMFIGELLSRNERIKISKIIKINHPLSNQLLNNINTVYTALFIYHIYLYLLLFIVDFITM